MGKVKATNEHDEKILRDNFMDPSRYGVTAKTETEIKLLCYKTGDEITIRKGLRAW